jgi:hypothetical protein
MFQEREEGCASKHRLFITTERRMSGEFLCEDSFAKDVGRGRVRGLIVFETA